MTLVEKIKKNLIFVVVFISLFGGLLASIATSDIDSGSEHYGLMETSNEKMNCRLCHAGMPLPTPLTEDKLTTEAYRCFVCHQDAIQDINHALANSTHKGIYCTQCHDVYHKGHRGYYTSTKGAYGCVSSGCHNIATMDYNPPSSTSVNFVTYYQANKTDYQPDFLIIEKAFNPTLPTRLGKGMYTDAYIDVSTNSYSDIPSTKRYWACMKCHFIKEEPAPSTTQDTYWVTHTDTCYTCHSNSTGYTTNYAVDPHTVQEHSPTYSWESCKSCHSSIAQQVENSIHGHKGVGCRCHSVIHVSKYNATGSWITSYLPDPGNFVSPECSACHATHGNIQGDVSAWRRIYFYNEVNGTLNGVVTHPIDEGGETRYMDIYYITRFGNATLITGSEFRLMTCFNCHFVSDEPLLPSVKPVELGWKIPIQREDVYNISNPHNITINNNSTINYSQEYRTTSPYIVLLLSLIISLGGVIYLSRTGKRETGI